jgi:hypothetical protein
LVWRRECGQQRSLDTQSSTVEHMMW